MEHSRALPYIFQSYSQTNEIIHLTTIFDQWPMDNVTVISPPPHHQNPMHRT